MRTKVIPVAPADLETIERVRSAVPLVPGRAEDCCSRIVGRVGDVVHGRDDANRWLAFLEALDLVAEYDRGFARTRTAIDRETLADRFSTRVYGAREVQHILTAADGPLGPEAVFERFEPAVPPWERDRDPDGWRARWTDRVNRLLDWIVLLGLAESTAEGYRPPPDHDP